MGRWRAVSQELARAVGVERMSTDEAILYVGTIAIRFVAAATTPTESRHFILLRFMAAGIFHPKIAIHQQRSIGQRLDDTFGLNVVGFDRLFISVIAQCLRWATIHLFNNALRRRSVHIDPRAYSRVENLSQLCPAHFRMDADGWFPNHCDLPIGVGFSHVGRGRMFRLVHRSWLVEGVDRLIVTTNRHLF